MAYVELTENQVTYQLLHMEQSLKNEFILIENHFQLCEI